MNETDTAANSFTDLAVAVGRIEEKVSRVAGMEDRLREVERTVERIEAQQRPRPPWWEVAAGVTGILSGVATVGS